MLLGVDAPVAGGKLITAASYMDAKQSDRQKGMGSEYDFTEFFPPKAFQFIEGRKAGY